MTLKLAETSVLKSCSEELTVSPVIFYRMTFIGGSVVEWLGCRTCNLTVARFLATALLDNNLRQVVLSVKLVSVIVR